MAATTRDNGKGSIVSGSSIIAAGLASAVAAAVTSRFGWAGTIIGAALTTMIVTGGSAILGAYLLNMKSRVQAAPGNIRAAARRVRPQREQGAWLPDDPGLRDNFVGRLRGSLGWFSRLPVHQRRSILKRGLLGAAAAFVVGVLVITAVEFTIGNSYSCGFWGRCSYGSAPGIGGGNVYTGGHGYSVLAGGSSGSTQQSPYGQPVPQGGGLFDGQDQQLPAQPQQQSGGGFFGGGSPQESGGVQQPGSWGGSQPQQPAQPQQPSQPVPETPAQPQQPVPEAPSAPTE